MCCFVCVLIGRYVVVVGYVCLCVGLCVCTRLCSSVVPCVCTMRVCVFDHKFAVFVCVPVELGVGSVLCVCASACSVVRVLA